MFRLTCVIAAAWLLALAPAAAQNAPATLAGVDAAAVEDLVVANRILAERGIIDAYGHVSMRHPTNPNRYLMARALAPALVTAADVMEFDLEFQSARPARALDVQRALHPWRGLQAAAGRERRHSHPFDGRDPVRRHPGAAQAGDPYRLVPARRRAGVGIREAGGVTNMLVNNAALGKSLATALGDKPVALMRGHGNVVVGPNLRVAVARAVFTDENARMQSVALAMGGPINYISPEEGAKRDREPGDPSRAWELWKALAMKKAPAN